MPDATQAPTTVAWFPVLTTFLGFAAGAVAEYLRDSRTNKREREARSVARRQQVADRRREFQRETLLSLQEAILAQARSAGKMHHIDEMEYRKTGKWGSNLFPADVDNESRETGVMTLILMARVRDEKVRELSKTFRDYANRAGLCRSKEDAYAMMNGMTTSLDPLYDRISEVLRQLDDDDTTSDSLMLVKK